MKCPICGGTGDTTNTIPPTNEQWFCSLPTEEKAEWFASFDSDFYPCGIFLNCNPLCRFYKHCVKDDVIRPKNKEVWLEWLKQPHKEQQNDGTKK